MWSSDSNSFEKFDKIPADGYLRSCWGIGLFIKRGSLSVVEKDY